MKVYLIPINLPEMVMPKGIHIVVKNTKIIVNLQNYKLESPINTRHLRNVAPLLRAQRPSRHKNCRIGGLMFDIQRT